MRILLLSAYDASSHRSWREGLMRHIDASWTVRTLPPRHFGWRVRSNPLSWYSDLRCLLEQESFDALLCTSMVDLATLRGLCPSLCAIPNVVYFHENQFAYPTQKGTIDPGLGLLNAYTALAADYVVFNSEFNQRTMLDGLEKLLKRMPDGVPRDVVEQIRMKSEVLPVGIEALGLRLADKSAQLKIVWNHRWEYDKGPERLFAALNLLKARGVNFSIDVLGQQFRQIPPCFEVGQANLHGYIGRWGFVAREEYVKALREAHIVVSTALHEFQGLAVLEAVSAGCVPVVPDRLAYQEIIPSRLRYPSSDDHLKEAEGLADILEGFSKEGLPSIDLSDVVKAYEWRSLIPRYEQILHNVKRNSSER